MRPRILRTTKLLAVAVTAAGCAPNLASPATEPATAAAEVVVDTPAPVATAPAPAVTAPAPVATTPAATPAPAVTQGAVASAPAPAPAESPRRGPRAGDENPALVALRDKLVNLEREAALAQAPRFRPLCDADGYPLVGNLNRKGPTYNPSSFCKDVRDRGGAQTAGRR